MLPSNPICPVCDYGISAVYKDLPNEEQLRTGVVPLDSLPAAWWNAMWCCTNHSINQARDAVGSLIDELNTVLACGNVTACDTCVDNLYQAIENIRTTYGNAVTAGAVKSSSTPGEVSIGANGVMIANCVGNATNLTTTAHTIVGAINELKSTYDCCISDLVSSVGGLGNSKAPTNHASATTTYGVGNATDYGHVKLSDTYASLVGAACDGVAASQKAVYDMYTCLSCVSGAPVGNTAGCALGTAAAGTCSTAARSDHVHPVPSCVARADYANGAGCARCAQSLYIGGVTWTSAWYWSGQGGQPSWLWGSNDGVNMYVWNPSNFTVHTARHVPVSQPDSCPGAIWVTHS